VSAADEAAPSARPRKRASAFRTIGEVAEDLEVPAHVLRFWETKFPQLKPLKRGGGRRYYRPEDIQLLRRIRRCLYQEGYTIRGVQRLLSELTAPVPPEETEPTVTLFPLEPLPRAEPPPAAKRGRPTPGRGLRPELRAALEELRRDLLEIRALIDPLSGGSEEC
jgi:DNA-binding transcriptional MerR regulator